MGFKVFGSTGANTHYMINEINYIILGYTKWIQEEVLVLNFAEFAKASKEILNAYITTTDLTSFEKYMQTYE
jgi:hypothetical protein